MPDSLISFPCQVVGAGYTEESLVKGYVHNTTCVGEYQSVMEGINNYNQTLKEKGKEDVK